MAAYPVIDNRYPPVYQRTFTTFPRTLHSADAPANAQYLPSKLILQVATGDVLEWTDIDGVTNTITFTAAEAGLHSLRIPAVTLTANTTCNVTVCWSQKG
jgi:hypothetical protein